MIDFTNCKRIMSKAYSGANGKKIAIEYRGEQYMLKFPPSGREKPTELSYTNSCYSEHIGSSIFNMLGIEAQKTIMGSFTVGSKKKIVCACRDFTAGGKQLYDFCAIKNTVIDSEHGGTGTELEDIMDTIAQQTFVNPDALSLHFWDMFVTDALLGNFDRHNGNWGFLVDIITQETSIAPIYDCGSCLLPQADEKIMRAVLTNEDELNARIYQFPTSAVKLNGRKINYHDFITSCKFEECNAAVKRLVPRIDMKQIEAFIDGVKELSELQKSFYKQYLNGRYEKILLSAYKKL
ncbi:MAG: HipA domain-containing protein [Clostridia bacterium]|nr:HipA domain-containing protein [Clostridia bacterium]